MAQLEVAEDDDGVWEVDFEEVAVDFDEERFDLGPLGPPSWQRLSRFYAKNIDRNINCDKIRPRKVILESTFDVSCFTWINFDCKRGVKKRKCEEEAFHFSKFGAKIAFGAENLGFQAGPRKIFETAMKGSPRLFHCA